MTPEEYEKTLKAPYAAEQEAFLIALLNGMGNEITMKLKDEADAAIAYLKRSTRPAPEGESLRDFLDGWTQGDLDCLQLDILTDMVAKRIDIAEGVVSHYRDTNMQATTP